MYFCTVPGVIRSVCACLLSCLRFFFFHCSFPNSCHQQSQEWDAMCYVYISTPFGSTHPTSVSKVCHRYYCLVQSTVKNPSPFIHAHATNRTQTCCGIYELYSLSLCHTCPPMIELFPVPVSFFKNPPFRDRTSSSGAWSRAGFNDHGFPNPL